MRRRLRALITHNIPTTREVLGMFITAIIGGLIFTYSIWAQSDISVAEYLTDFLGYTFITLLTVFFVEAGRRIWASQLDYKVDYRMWVIGLGLSLATALYTSGWIAFLLIGGFTVKEIKHTRIGYYQDRLKFRDIAKIGFGGILFGVLWLFIASTFTTPTVGFAIAVMLMGSLVPIDIILKTIDRTTPSSAGTALLWGSRPLFVFSVALVCFAGLLAYFIPSLLALIITLILAAIAAAIWIWNIELK